VSGIAETAQSEKLTSAIAIFTLPPPIPPPPSQYHQSPKSWGLGLGGEACWHGPKFGGQTWAQAFRQVKTGHFQTDPLPKFSTLHRIEKCGDQTGGGVPCCHDPQARFTQAARVSRLPKQTQARSGRSPKLAAFSK